LKDVTSKKRNVADQIMFKLVSCAVIITHTRAGCDM